jgi:hypothetical protein
MMNQKMNLKMILSSMKNWYAIHLMTNFHQTKNFHSRQSRSLNHLLHHRRSLQKLLHHLRLQLLHPQLHLPRHLPRHLLPRHLLPRRPRRRHLRLRLQRKPWPQPWWQSLQQRQRPQE